MRNKIIYQKMLSTECWSVQIWGIEACNGCEYKGTDDCGGKQILSTGRNHLGHKMLLCDLIKNTRRHNEG